MLVLSAKGRIYKEVSLPRTSLFLPSQLFISQIAVPACTCLNAFCQISHHSHRCQAFHCSFYYLPDTRVLHCNVSPQGCHVYSRTCLCRPDETRPLEVPAFASLSTTNAGHQVKVKAFVAGSRRYSPKSASSSGSASCRQTSRRRNLCGPQR